MFSSCNPKLFAVGHIHYPVNPSSVHFHTEAVVPSSDPCRNEAVLPPSDHDCNETVATSGDHYCICVCVGGGVCACAAFRSTCINTLCILFYCLDTRVWWILMCPV